MEIRVEDVINFLTKPVGALEKTVDTLKAGALETLVTGIAVSFMPTYEVIQKAVEIGANLLITHEGVFFSHWDKLASDFNRVYDKKQKLINDSGIAIFRLHDYIHRFQPDGITNGLVEALEWDNYVEEHQPVATILSIPEMTVQEVGKYVKNKLGIEYIRCVGNLSMPCSRVGLLVGYRGGGETAIPLFEKYHLDLVLYGEGPEWETPEYVRDAISQGDHKALLIVGHAESEEPGMKGLARTIKEEWPSIPVHFIPTESAFQLI
ncbi:Nif3-like dinuclear metal center hexameric protein [Pullulanibacillus sp. KACC 23026]|uniref:Nif3-like dinuclear metal center hexameric protein n=1 Tax=Pullulanibacillus sp. KACC 23026 TaxID=3028315 RepID=UPI0023B1BE29|nr:Nif3-like dinuclear metal center hexameric protein [Pullulanibacillus sp. KACC 23026]WEG11870.1 Nif3-like dinuclear metal center hexameric protein [Pullulanibacillus sp. KACC 23026]